MIDSYFRLMRSFPGKLRLARILLKKDIDNKKDVIFTGKHGITYCTPNIKETIGFELYVNGIYEESIINFILSKTPSDARIVDMGANIGAIALPLAKLKKNAKILCIEASPKVYKYLIKNISTNNADNCTCLNNVISDSDDLLVNFYSPDEKFGKGSMSSLFTTEPDVAKTVSIDSLIKLRGIDKIDFIKADIEGYEFYAFKGSEKLLSAADSPDILFEFVDWAENAAINLKAGDAQELLVKFGYNLFKLNDKSILLRLDKILTTGSAMIFATKKTV